MFAGLERCCSPADQADGARLGSSFAFIGGYAAGPMLQMLPQQGGCCPTPASASCWALCILIAVALFKIFGTQEGYALFSRPLSPAPYHLYRPDLSSTAITSCRDNWAIALIAIAIVVGCNIWGKRAW